MKAEIRNGTVHISGYVNAVGRDSRPILSSTGEFVEMIEPGTFREALTRAKNVDVLLNHDNTRRLGGTEEGNLSLREDSIGLYAECDVSDTEVLHAAKKGELRGWSFGMYVKKAEMEQRSDNIPRRHVKCLDLFEVSILCGRHFPAHAGTSVECRDNKRILTETRIAEEPAEVTIKDGGAEQRDEWQKKVNELNIKLWQDKVNEYRKGFD